LVGKKDVPLGVTVPGKFLIAATSMDSSPNELISSSLPP
jgi:hypothetical protein